MTVKQATKTRRTLIGAVRSELKRLRRPSVTVAGLGLIALFTLVGTFVVFNSGEGILTASMPPGMGIPTDVSSARGLVAGVPMSADLIGIVVLSLWAAAAGSDYATGWIRVMVQAEPRRWRLLAGKGFALAIFTVVATLVATSVAVALAPPLASMMSVSTELWYEGTVSLFVESWLNLTIAVLVWGMIGFAIATVSRSAVVAIAGGIGYLMAFEGMLGLAAESATTYLPGSILAAVVAGGTDDLSYGAALGLAVLIAVIAGVVSTIVFSRRDITD